MSGTTENPEQSLPLPTARLLLEPAALSIAAGGCWALAAAVLGRAMPDVIGALLAGMAAALAAALAMLLIRPWRPRALVTWPFVFLAGTVIHLLAVLAGGMLLYSASIYGTVSTWLCLVVSYWVGLFGLVRVYGSCMRQTAAAGPDSPRARDTTSTEPSE